MRIRKVNIILLEGAKIPEYKSALSAGCDLYSCQELNKQLQSTCRHLFSTGIKIELPEDAEMQIRSRSGLAYKNGVVVLNSPGTVDADYKDVVGVILINHGNEPITFKHNDRIAQAVFYDSQGLFQAEFNVVTEFERNDDRGGGFGHTGV